MGTYVALLRGINVGKNKRVAMADLRAVIESLGYRDVRTLLNSGNAVFASPRPLRKSAATDLQAALLKKTGVSSRFTLRSAAELEETIQANPLLGQATDHTRLFATFVTDPADMSKVAALLKQSWKPESIAAGPGVVYVWCPNGLLESKAQEAVGRALGDGMTVRNWATVMKLRALTG
ncbi:MAG TPA: DUF1697 domain-containing protein [Gemmatimonadaceae bacterium]